MDSDEDSNIDTASSSSEEQAGTSGKQEYIDHERKKEDTEHRTPEPESSRMIQFDTSGFEWFWRNYYRTFDWQRTQQFAYWKSYTIALQQENMMLHKMVKDMVSSPIVPPPGAPSWQQYSHRSAGVVVKKRRSRKSRKRKRKRNAKKRKLAQEAKQMDNSVEITDDEDDPNFEFLITDDMLDFFEQSLRHKIELRKQREAEQQLAKEEDPDYMDPTLPPREQVGLQRTQEMKLLYGKAAPMILGMETAMQLGFDRNCDANKPVLWPNIPFKL